MAPQTGPTRSGAVALGDGGILPRVMSKQNVETVRRVYEAWNRDDPEAALVVMHPDVELRNPTDVFLGTQSVYRGHAGIREFWKAAKEPWEYFKSHIERTLVKDDKVVT